MFRFQNGMKKASNCFFSKLKNERLNMTYVRTQRLQSGVMLLVGEGHFLHTAERRSCFHTFLLFPVMIELTFGHYEATFNLPELSPRKKTFWSGKKTFWSSIRNGSAENFEMMFFCD